MFYLVFFKITEIDAYNIPKNPKVVMIILIAPYYFSFKIKFPHKFYSLS